MPSSSLCQVLSLDGGGCWALLQVRALQRLYGRHAGGRDVLKHFDVAVANSGGAIVLLAMTADFTLEAIAQLFRTAAQRDAIFQPTAFSWRNALLRRIAVAPKYSTERKHQALRNIVLQAPHQGPLDPMDALLRQDADLPHMVVCAYDFDRNRETFFVTRPHRPPGDPPSRQSPPVTLVDAVHASSTPPVAFFDAPAAIQTVDGATYRYWDGAVGGYNNPVLAGLLEAQEELGHALARIRVLSLGTGCAPEAIHWDPQARAPSGLRDDVQKMAQAVLNDPPDAATRVADAMLRATPVAHIYPIVRMNPLRAKTFGEDGTWHIPQGLSPEAFAQLRRLDLDAVQQADIDLIDHFGALWMDAVQPYPVINQAIRPTEHLLPHGALGGHATFAAAQQAFDQWRRNSGPSLGVLAGDHLSNIGL